MTEFSPVKRNLSMTKTPITSYLSHPNIFLNSLFSNTLNLRSALNMTGQVLYPYTTSTSIVLYTLNLDSGPNGSQHSLRSACSYIPHEWNFHLLGLFPHLWTLPHFQRIYYPSLCLDFFAHPVYETWSYTLCPLNLLTDQHLYKWLIKLVCSSL